MILRYCIDWDQVTDCLRVGSDLHMFITNGGRPIVLSNREFFLQI